MFRKAKPESPAFFVGRFLYPSGAFIGACKRIWLCNYSRNIQGKLKNYAFKKKKKIIWEISYSMKWWWALCVEVQGMTFTSTLPCPSWHMVEAFAKPRLKGMAEDFFVFYKAKKQFFKGFFKLQFSSEVNSDEAYRWKSVLKRIWYRTFIQF